MPNPGLMKTIDTLVKDIEEILVAGVPREQYDVEGYGEELGKVFSGSLEPRDADRGTRVWFSNVGSPYARQLWYRIHDSDNTEDYRANTKFKFMYGDILESLTLRLAALAGHVVEHEQERLEVSVGGRVISGRIDAVIDGHLIDVKSASKYSFQKFIGGLKRKDDAFGYLGQLLGYLVVARENELIPRDSLEASFLVVNKETGNIYLDTHTFTEADVDKWYEDAATRLDDMERPAPPERGFEPVDDGYTKDKVFRSNGNKKLGVNCSYCDAKFLCHPGLRVFLYGGNKPVFFTKVYKTPKVPEIGRKDLDDYA